MQLQFREGDALGLFETAIKADMTKHIDHFTQEVKKIRTGRAHTSLVEDLAVDCYGNIMRVRDLATVSAPEAQLIVIQPWDQTTIGSIEEAITQANLGVTPQNDGKVIRIRLSPMSIDQREQLIKTLGKKLEECKVAIRNTRKDVQNFVKDNEKAKKISEDTGKRLQNALDKLTGTYTDQADALSAKKEQEIKSL